MGMEVGIIWEKMGKEEHDQNILYKIKKNNSEKPHTSHTWHRGKTKQYNSHYNWINTTYLLFMFIYIYTF